jgi:ribulose-5-phosphate 4-epimerase/fuculose-1-phosphate aldolase
VAHTPTPYEGSELLALCQCAKRLDATQALPATGGNLSIRAKSRNEIPEGMWITRSGYHKRDTTLRRMVWVGLDGKTTLPGTVAIPSDETPLHACLYRHLPMAQAVIHAHPNECEKWTDSHVKLSNHELLKIFGSKTHDVTYTLLVLPNIQDRHKLSEEFERVLKEQPKGTLLAPGIILENHGIYCYGRSAGHAEAIYEAMVRLLSRK